VSTDLDNGAGVTPTFSGRNGLRRAGHRAHPRASPSATSLGRGRNAMGIWQDCGPCRPNAGVIVPKGEPAYILRLTWAAVEYN